MLSPRLFEYHHARHRRRRTDGIIRRLVAIVVGAVAFFCAPSPLRAASDLSLLDVIELDTGYTTLADHYYRGVSPQQLLDGARVGMASYLRGRGIADPHIAIVTARADGRGVVPAIEQQLGRAIVRYGSRVEPHEFVYAAIRGEVASLHDPYSVFFSRAEMHAFTIALDGRSFGGVGLVLARDDTGTYRADQVFDDGPAARAGVAPGDVLLAVDGAPVAGLAGEAITRRLRGAIGTPVQLALQRAGSATTLSVRIVRAAIVAPDITSRVLSPSVGYLALRTFGLDAGMHVRKALAQLRTAGATSTVFDLRGNGGGYESEAARVASAFVPAGPIVATQAKRGRRSVTNADGTALAPLPLVVLVDGDSASGSELVTGAIADHGLATVIGTRTFGKGLVQTLFPLPDGSALKVTTARYFTPNGHDIDRVGIMPDLVVGEPADAQRGVPGHDPQLDAALELLRKRQ